MAEERDRYMGRVTIDAEGYVIGSGGSSVGGLMVVEQNGLRVGMASRAEFEHALHTRKKLQFAPDSEA